MAKLARLALTDEETERMQHDLAEMLSYFERITQLDVDDVEPLAGPSDRSAPLSDDEPRNALPHEALMRIAPTKHEPFVAVPKVLGGESSS